MPFSRKPFRRRPYRRRLYRRRRLRRGFRMTFLNPFKMPS
jgi:hypothetical protein